jgi:hypothetical protein
MFSPNRLNFCKPVIAYAVRKITSKRYASSSSSYITNQFIKYGDAPACVNCFYFQKSSAKDLTFSKCLKYGTKDLITGNIRYEYTTSIRDHLNTKCGTKGTHFMKKDEFDYGTNP